jgi:PST family polysaccharide transporter
MLTRTAALGLGVDSPATRNFAWLAGDKTLATLFGVLVFGLIARRYGPVGSGHYAFAVTLLQTALGLSLVCGNAAVLPRVVRMRHGIPAAIANIFVVRLLGSLVATALVAAYAVVAIAEPERLVIALLMLAVAPLIEPFFVASMYWQSRNDNRIPVTNRSVGLFTRTAMVAAAIALDAPLWVPALAWCAEGVVLATLHARSIACFGSWRTLARHVSAWRATRYFRYGVRFLLGLALAQLFLRTDRLVLGQLLPAHDFGLYATAMQLVDVWLQVAQIIGVSIGPAFLYAALTRRPKLSAHWRTIAGLAAIGIGGFVFAVLFGRPLIGLVFGAQFDTSYPYLIAGTAFGVLSFIDTFAHISVSVARRPGALATKWAVSVIAALASQFALFPLLHAYAGPAGLAIGLVAGWLALLLMRFTRPEWERRTAPAVRPVQTP